MPDDTSAPRRPHPSAALPAALLRDSRRRPMAEYLMPAAIIVAGILLVVAFGIVINSVVRGKEPTALPAPPPPALGDIPPASDQAVIPLPSDPPSAGTPSPARPSTTPPARKTRPPAPPPNAVTIAKAAVPGKVDLSDEGDRDWVHWGQEGKFSLERAKDGDFQILEGAPTAPRFRQTRAKEQFSWQDGSPVASSGGTVVGINTCDKGNGFTLSVPAAKDDRTLRLYVGVQKAKGTLGAKLSTGGSTEAGTLEERGDGFATAVFKITYRSAQGGKLNLTWTTTETFGDGCGGVALQAATLR
ncbi:hypothetical protein AB0M54_31865 [Actinoplanes sp. NPDC051470]|uniref:hypothetical protein n=1 Tax=Actinoplanes sp. NPDC051470 TaxID=3157224 RepID=UPI003421AF8C